MQDRESNLKHTTRACFPGSFNPPTIAHLAIADAAYEQLALSSFTFVLSRTTLAKVDADMPSPEERSEQLRLLAPSCDVVITTHSLLVDIAVGYEWLIMGADKWHQINEARWYENELARDHAIGLLPSVALVPRGHDTLPNEHERLRILRIDDAYRHVSSSDVRAGRIEWHAR